jgi:hypothetical protein
MQAAVGGQRVRCARGGGMQRGPTLAHLAAKRIQLCGTHVRCGEGEGAHVVSPSNFGDELQRPVCSPGPAQFRARCPDTCEPHLSPGC